MHKLLSKSATLFVASVTLFTFNVRALEIDTDVKSNAEKNYRLGITYNRSTFTPNKDLEGYFGRDVDSRSLNGIGLEWHAAWQIIKNVPFYGEVGLEGQFGWFSKTEKIDFPKKYYTGTDKMQNLTFSIPVGVSFRLNFTNNFSIQPLIGIDMKFTAMLRKKVDYNDSYKKDFNLDRKVTEWKNMLSDDKDTGMGNSKACWESFQVGWHAGANINWGDMYVGVTYGTDFIPAFKYEDSKIASSTLKVSLGTYF